MNGRTTMGKRVSVTSDSDSSRNEQFRDNLSGRSMTRAEFVRQIQSGGDYALDRRQGQVLA
jgi:hypothetical protein